MSCLVCGRPETVAPFVAQHQYGGGVCRGCKQAPIEALEALELLEALMRRTFPRDGEPFQQLEVIHRHVQAAAHSVRPL